MHVHLHIDLYHVIQVKKTPAFYSETKNKILCNIEDHRKLGKFAFKCSNCVLDILVNNQILHTTFLHINTCKLSLIIQHTITKKEKFKK